MTMIYDSCFSMNFICKHLLLWISVFIAWMTKQQMASSVSVPSLCLVEQRRLLNTSGGDVIHRPEDQILHTIDTICGSYMDYVNCFTANLPNSYDIGDRFSTLMYRAGSMAIAYRGLCILDLEALRDIKVCLVGTSELQDCYQSYEEGVTQVLSMLDQDQFSLEGIQDLACNVSVGRYRCETEIYGRCNPRAREIMQDFIFASLSDDCRQRTEVTSRYLTAFGAEDPNVYDSVNVTDNSSVSKHSSRMLFDLIMFFMCFTFIQ